jgi:hypothetical protein
MKAFLKYEGINDLVVVATPAGLDLQHSIGGVKGSLNPATLRAGYMQVDNKLEPVWDIEV